MRHPIRDTGCFGEIRLDKLKAVTLRDQTALSWKRIRFGSIGSGDPSTSGPGACSERLANLFRL